ncbi:glutamate synthase [Rhizophagus irregularis DAOM 181602=DAOM 197198]|nr:glutamate synthase [Rhizophagus irregularis DAOM 181602=DAOM 197198]
MRWAAHNGEINTLREQLYPIIEEGGSDSALLIIDGRYCGASLDRNGLRPCRFYITSDDLMICASEVDTEEGRVVDDRELKLATASQLDNTSISEDPRLRAFVILSNNLNLLVLPMTKDGKEALGSMGNDAPLACLSNQPRLIYDYFRQLFAQVTNPQLIQFVKKFHVIRMLCWTEGNILEINEQQTHRLALPSPILSIDELNAIKRMEKWNQIGRVCAEVSQAIQEGFKVVVLSDAAVNPENVSISSLIAVGGVHHYLFVTNNVQRLLLLLKLLKAREVHHVCVLLGYGADCYLSLFAMEAILKLKVKMQLVSCQKWEFHITKLQGAQIFEALGLDESVIARCFAGTASRIKGTTFDI